MATFLDITFFKGLTPILIFFLIFGVIYALLQSTEILGSSKSIHAIIAFVVGIFIAISSKSIKVIMGIVPWFVIIFIFLIFLLMAFKVFGVSDESIMNAGHDNSVRWTLIIISLIIIIGAISSAFGQEQLKYTDKDASPTIGNSDLYNADGSLSDNLRVGATDERTTNTGSFQNNVANTFYHPRVLGFILLVLVGAMTIVQLTKTT